LRVRGTVHSSDAKEYTVATTPKEIFERYVWSGAITRNAEAVAGLFTEDGVLESPLAPADAAYPRRMAGRDEIRDGLIALYASTADTTQAVNAAASRYVLHTTTDPDVFIAEIDTALDGPDGVTTTASLVQIFRIRDGQIALLRDYFAPDLVAPNGLSS
jgi:ketosteroid isomerase-like protein